MRRACALAILVGLVGNARAEGDRAAVVIASGQVDLVVESLVRAAAESGLRKQGLEVTPIAELAPAIDPGALDACVPQGKACVARLVASTPLDRVLLFSMRAGGSDGAGLELVAVLYDVPSGAQLALERRQCVHCDQPDQLAGEVDDVIAELLRRAERAELVGTPGAPAPERPDEPTELPARRFTGWKLTTFVGGLGLVAGGVTLVAIDGPRIVHGERRPEERATRGEGTVAIGVGAALLVTSAILWLAERPAGRPGLHAAAGFDGDAGGVALEGQW